MKPLTEQEKQTLMDLIRAGRPLPPVWKTRLFESGDEEFVEATKVYELTYKGKTPKQNVLSGTPSAPFQEVRSFNADNPFPDKWRNLLIYGDNLLALKTLYDDQRGPNRYGTRNKIKLIYIDPPLRHEAGLHEGPREGLPRQGHRCPVHRVPAETADSAAGDPVG